MRGISLISVVSRWFMHGLMHLAKQDLKRKAHHRWRKILMCGFEPGHSCEMIITGVSVLLRRGHAWSSDKPLYVFSGDILAAFDNLALAVVLEAMRYWSIHPRIRAAFACEMNGHLCLPNLQGVELDETFQFSRSVRQGGVESAWQWCLVARMVLDRLISSWESRGFGIELPEFGSVTHAVWADNIYLFSHHREHNHTMAQELTKALHDVRLTWKLQYLHTNSHDTSGDMWLKVQEDHVKVSKVATLAMLGSILSVDGSSFAAMEHRITKGTACFWSLAPYLTEKTVPLRKRFEEYDKHVSKSVLYAAGGWIWGVAMFQRLYRWENSLLRNMLRSPRRGNEDFVGHIQRSTTMARHLFHRWGFQSVCTLVLKSIFRLASHMQYLAMPSPTTLSLQFLPCACLWRNNEWWGIYQAVWFYIDPREEEQTWRHTRTGRIPQWEDLYCKVFGNRWQDLAKTPSWTSHWKPFLEGAYAAISVRPPEVRFASAVCRVAAVEPARKRPRLVSWSPVAWTPVVTEAVKREILGDSELVIQWLCGQWDAKCLPYQLKVRQCIQSLENAYMSAKILPRSPSAEIYRHIYRELNTEADALANRAFELGAEF